MNQRLARPTRRAFLKHTGLAVAGAGWAGCHSVPTAQPHSSIGTAEVRVQLTGAVDPLTERVWCILRDRLQQRGVARVVRVSSRADVVLTVNRGLPAEAFLIENAGRAVRVAGGSPQGLLFGVGKFLRTSSYEPAFQASAWRGLSRPQGSLRGMYFATHFHNWHHQASPAEVTRYVEDLALWGIHAFMVIFPMINLRDWNDPQAEPAMEMVRQYARAVRALGLQFATGVNNTMFIGAPAEIRAKPLPDPTGRRGNSGHPICPSNPAGHAYLMENAARLFQRLADVGLDILVHWPYDEGGCCCEHCQPWGSRGYLKLSREFTALGRKTFPQLKSVLSTWMFDTPPEGEWAGLSEELTRDRTGVDYILADAHEDFPRYPLDVGVPGSLPLLNFPEISMWGNGPWGGVGAHPLPARCQRLWNQVKHVVRGGFPYSEGIYEDINKAVVAQFYWERDRSARATLAEYVDYEFGAAVRDDALALIEILEQSATAKALKQPVDKDAVARAHALAESMQGRVPSWAAKNWRWEILHLRAVLDRERFVGGGLTTPVAEKALLRLVEIYHAQLETDDPYHHRVRPPLRQAIDRAGRK